MEAYTARSIDPIFARYPPPPPLFSSSPSLSLDVEYDIIANSNDVVAGGDARSLTIFSPEGFKRVAAGAARIDRRINRPIDTKHCGYRRMHARERASSNTILLEGKQNECRIPITDPGTHRINKYVATLSDTIFFRPIYIVTRRCANIREAHRIRIETFFDRNHGSYQRDKSTLRV